MSKPGLQVLPIMTMVIVSCLICFPASSHARVHLVYTDVQKDGLRGVDGLAGAASVIVSPDGKNLYVAGYDDDAVAVFGCNATSGMLTFVEVQKDGVGGVDGLGGPWSVTLSPDGKHLYVAGYGDDAVAVFSRDALRGGLTFVEVQKDGIGGVDGLFGANSVALSPDGEYLYTAGYDDDAVAVFSRNATSGGLTFVEVQKDGMEGVDGLRGAFSVTVSPDGKHIYVAGHDDDAVAVFSRDALSGALAFVEVQKDGIGGVDGLLGPWSVTASPEGKNLYVAGAFSDAVAVFNRDTTSGALTFVELQSDGLGGVDGLWGVSSVTLPPDGNQLYATGTGDDAVAVFGRDATNGTLSFVEVQKNGLGGVDGLDGASSVTVNPDGKFLYTTGYYDNAIVVFRIQLLNKAMPWLPLLLND